MVLRITGRCQTLCLCLVFCLSIVCCKQIEFYFCLPQHDFYQILNRECRLTVRKSLNDAFNPIQTRETAKSFLRGRKYKRAERDEPSRRTDYYEECCIEGCRTEEIMEYC